jgi:hypothetical protein
MSTRLERALARAAADLTAEGVGFALIGGLAVSTADDTAAEHTVHALVARGYTMLAVVG